MKKKMKKELVGLGLTLELDPYHKFSLIPNLKLNKVDPRSQKLGTNTMQVGS